MEHVTAALAIGILIGCVLGLIGCVIQFRRINAFADFMTGYLDAVSKRATEAIKAGDYNWRRFYTLDISASYDAITPLSLERYSNKWEQFLVHKTGA